ncbi:MAG: hypothetical protein HLUCCA11_24315 [Phormidesmis priestleyi Ana]|uniref:Uncharacterized protein n=1 Tax=Phormidesmis priestleyi Ana TaxID=1666911 RepID=A0A0P7YLP6_9CYAN|nr:MAG: hypothetical protein HLUCCA11_24315 [Phormidesmis priestleyi Ana]
MKKADAFGKAKSIVVNYYSWANSLKGLAKFAAIVLPPLIIFSLITAPFSGNETQDTSSVVIEAPKEELSATPEIATEPKLDLETEPNTDPAIAPEAKEEPMTPGQELLNRLVLNTPGLLARERMGLLDADTVYETMPDICAIVQDPSYPLTESKALMADMAQRHMQADAKQAENMAEGFVKTALEPGVCN